MTCYHPNKGFFVGYKENGKKDMKFTSHKVEYLWSYFADFSVYNRSEIPFEDSTYVNHDAVEVYDEFLLVDRTCKPIPVYYCVESVHLPCGQCIGCRIDKSREWANRMCMESSYYDSNCFLTLTYDDKNVPEAAYFDSDERLEKKALTLRKRDFQLFMKRLRRRVFRDEGIHIRFYACGEYGSRTQRPHYHVVIFNWFPSDARYFKHDSRGYNFYVSGIVSDCWKYGNHLVSNMTWETCAYTARYVTKKLGNKESEVYERYNIEPEFTVMSRKPGLSNQFFHDHKLSIYYDENEQPIIRLPNGDNPLKFRPPRYFDNLFDVEDSSRLQEVKILNREIAKNNVDLKLSRTDLNYYELLEVEELNFKERVKTLRRN